MRIALLLSSLVFSACTVGEVGSTSSNNSGTDGGTGGSDGGSATGANVCVDRLATPDAAHLHLAGGTSNKGQNCIAAGCHLNNSLGAGAPGYQFAGTVYAAGTTNPSPGAVVRIVSGTTILQKYADADGNFYFEAPALPGAFTATTSVSACPTLTPMITQLVGGNGGGAGANSCNLCHTTGANAQAAPISL
ncbi:MAG TPA: hypothetical protein VHW23_27435 [Kofleriaceae bacterium]|jgi:hypothetical protein|nr:hypothetical protein [Kofleriaceae bacterium]